MDRVMNGACADAFALGNGAHGHVFGAHGADTFMERGDLDEVLLAGLGNRAPERSGVHPGPLHEDAGGPFGIGWSWVVRASVKSSSILHKK